MVLLTVFGIFLFLDNIFASAMRFHLTNFHADYPDARVIIATCGETISFPCRIAESEVPSTTHGPIMWYRLYENAYPDVLIVGDRQIISDQRFMLRTQNSNDRHLEIIGVRKDDQGYYMCKSGGITRATYNLTITTNSCIDIVPTHSHVTISDTLRLVCRIRSIDTFDEKNVRVKWTHKDYPLTNMAECLSNYSSIDGILYETLIIRKARRSDTGIYTCQYGSNLLATAHVIVNQNPSGSKSRRLISQIGSNSSSLNASLGTVAYCFYILYQIVLVALVVRS